MEKHIFSDIKKKFDLFQIIDVAWKPSNFAANIARFYGKKLPKGYKKEKETGSGTFRVYLVYDKNPHISGNVNLAINTCKECYRQLTGGGNLVHAAANSAEVAESLLLLFGKTIREIEQEEPSFLPKMYEKEVIGCPKWETAEEFVETVKKIDNTHIRAYKNSYLIHTKNADFVRRIINASTHFKLPGMNRYFVEIGTQKMPIYIRKTN